MGWLSLGQLISWGSVFYLFALVMVPVEKSFDLSRTQSSLAFSLALLFEGLLAYPVGRWIDRGHGRWVMTGGSVLVAVCLFLHSLVTGPIGFYAVWAGLGAGMAATLYTPVLAVFHLALVAPLHWLCLKNAPKRKPQTTHAVAGEIPQDSLRQHLRSVPFMLVGVFVVLTMGVTAALPTHMVTLLRESGMGESWPTASFPA